MSGTYHCSNCREKTSNLKKIAIGEARNVVFCGTCNCYLAIEEEKAAAPKAPSESK